MSSFIQIGEVVMRDRITGEPQGEAIPIYARSKSSPAPSGFTRGEEKLLTDAAGIYMDLFKEQSTQQKQKKEQPQ